MSTSGEYGSLSTPGSKFTTATSCFDIFSHSLKAAVNRDLPEPAVPIINVTGILCFSFCVRSVLVGCNNFSVAYALWVLNLNYALEKLSVNRLKLEFICKFWQACTRNVNRFGFHMVLVVAVVACVLPLKLRPRL